MNKKIIIFPILVGWGGGGGGGRPPPPPPLDPPLIWSDFCLFGLVFNPDKTEIIICSNMEVPNNLNFPFNADQVISNSSSHKHLSETLSYDSKCGKHKENISKTISKH